MCRCRDSIGIGTLPMPQVQNAKHSLGTRKWYYFRGKTVKKRKKEKSTNRHEPQIVVADATFRLRLAGVAHGRNKSQAADEHDKAWEIVTELVVAKMKADDCPVVGEGSSSTMDMEDEWMKAVAESTNKKSDAERAQDEINKWKIRTKPSDKDDPLKVWKQASKHCPYLAKVARDVLAVPATSAAPERKFSKAGDVNTKKRASITCENLEELVFLNEALPVVKKMRAEKEIKGASK